MVVEPERTKEGRFDQWSFFEFHFRNLDRELVGHFFFRAFSLKLHSFFEIFTFPSISSHNVACLFSLLVFVVHTICCKEQISSSFFGIW